MKFYRPKSILRLILVGFSLVALPLIVALVVATVSVDRLMSHSQHTLLQSVHITKGSQGLVEAITAMERNASQYQVLGDKVLFDAYQENHARFVDTARALGTLDLEDGQRALLEELRISEDEVYSILGNYPHDAPETVAVLSRFTGLAQTAQEILVDNRDLITRGVEEIQDKSKSVQRTLVVQAIALVQAALLLTVFFAVLIAWPIRQVDRAIRRLGDGQFQECVKVTGPRDLEQLGIQSVAIMPNDTEYYPEDSLANMKRVAANMAYPFPYLIDETQLVARAYGAVCTPDFFGYNGKLELQYRGMLDESRKDPNMNGVRRDLYLAMKQVAQTGAGPRKQIPSIGCSIKWRNVIYAADPKNE